MPKQPTRLTRAQIDAYNSDVVGIVQKVFYRLHDVADLHMMSAGAFTARATPLLGTSTPRNTGGDGITRYSAAAAAIGEALERYGACWVDPTRLTPGSARQLSDRGLPVMEPEQVRFFTPDQISADGFGLTSLDRDSETYWVEAAEVLSGERIYIPAQLAYLGNIPDAPQIHTSTSNGLAFGTEPYSALHTGMLELVERDAFMLTWYHQLSLPRIDITSSSVLTAFIAQHIAPAGLSISLIDLSCFSNVPVALSVARQVPGTLGPVGIGAAAAVDPETACMKAMREAIGSRSWAGQKIRNGSAGMVDTDWNETILDFEDHIDLFSAPEMHRYLDFLDANTETRPIEEIQPVSQVAEHAAHSLASRLAERLTTVYSVDVTSPDIREAGGYVIRAWSPELLPMDASYKYRYLGHPRLRNLPINSLAGKPDLSSSELNPVPHPFP